MFFDNLNTTLQIACRLHGCKKFVKTLELADSPVDADRLCIEWLNKGSQFNGCYGYRDHMKLFDEMFPQTVRVHTEKKKAPRRRGG